MKSLIWKEFRENLKWAVLPAILLLVPMLLFGVVPLLDKGGLFFVSLIAAGFGTGLGFLQIFFESQGDKRSLLLHRPLSSSQIFLGKAIAGLGLYLMALGIPFVGTVALVATPGHIDEPFAWAMTLPWLADALTGIIYYFAGMLTAEREARWYGSRCLGVGAAILASYLVWIVPEFSHALLVIAVLGIIVAVAAWGSFIGGGAYLPQPALAKLALAVTFLAGLSAASFTGKVIVGSWGADDGPDNEEFYIFDRQGRQLFVRTKDNIILSVTDPEGGELESFKGKRRDEYTFEEIKAPSIWSEDCPRTICYRSKRRFLVEYGNVTAPGNEVWYYVPAKGRLMGYDEDTKKFVGSYGPEGFCPPEQPPTDRFEGELADFSIFYMAWANFYLAFPSHVYTVDFIKRTTETVFVPPPGETVRWTSRWEDTRNTLAAVRADGQCRLYFRYHGQVRLRSQRGRLTGISNAAGVRSKQLSLDRRSAR